MRLRGVDVLRCVKAEVPKQLAPVAGIKRGGQPELSARSWHQRFRPRDPFRLHSDIRAGDECEMVATKQAVAIL